MTAALVTPASITRPNPQELDLAGAWTARGIGEVGAEIDTLKSGAKAPVIADGSKIDALDTAGAWLLHKLMLRLRAEGSAIELRGLRPEFGKLLDVVARHVDEEAAATQVAKPAPESLLARVGRASVATYRQTIEMLAFLGETAVAFKDSMAHPSRWRVRPILYNIRTAGFDALPIVGLLALLLGVVIAYQGATQLRQYGASIFVVDLVGLSMLREFAPLLTAIIVAGRSGSAYAAQIGTMEVTEEIDAMRTIGIAPMEMLVLPKLVALVIAMPLLTVFADFLGVGGGMLMARSQLGIGYEEFLDRLPKALNISSYLVGLGKAPVFAAIIVLVGCFQGFRTHGGADSVGRQTTRSVVQSIFLVIVADAVFSIVFSALDL